MNISTTTFVSCTSHFICADKIALGDYMSHQVSTPPFPIPNTSFPLFHLCATKSPSPHHVSTTLAKVHVSSMTSIDEGNTPFTYRRKPFAYATLYQIWGLQNCVSSSHLCLSSMHPYTYTCTKWNYAKTIEYILLCCLPLFLLQLFCCYFGWT